MNDQSKTSKWKRWVHPGQIRYFALEWWLMRLGFAIVVYNSFLAAGYHALNWAGSPGRGADFMTQPKPRGIAQFVDVTWINQPENLPQVAAAVGILLLLFILGRTPVIASLGLAYLHTVLGTLENSQGNNIWHTSQIVVVGLLGVGLAGIAEYVGALRRNGLAGLKERLIDRWRWPLHVLKNPRSIINPPASPIEETEEKGRSLSIYLVQQLIATAYVVSGISKLWISKGAWFTDVQFIGLQFDKNRLLKYYQTLQEPDAIRWAADAVNNHPTLASMLFSIGLLLELFCFVALFNRGLLALFGAGLAIMHLMIAQIMVLKFFYNEWMLAIFYVNVPFWILMAIRGKRCRQEYEAKHLANTHA